MNGRVLSLAVVLGLSSIAVGSSHAAPNTELEAWDGDEDVELFSAVLTARTCAEALMEHGDMRSVSTCSPLEAAINGYALFDPMEDEVYLIEAGSIRQFELERGFGGRADLSGLVIGTLDDTPVIRPDEYFITPKPKPGAFKGCL